MEQSQVSFGNGSNINKVKKSKLDEPEKSTYLRELNSHGFSVQDHYDKLIILCKRFDVIEKLNYFVNDILQTTTIYFYLVS